MTVLFHDDLHDEFGVMALGFTSWGGPEFGEIRAIAAAVGDGDGAAFCDAWVAAGDRRAAEGEAALAAGRVATARAALLRAASLYASSYRPLFGSPVDPRLLAAYRRQVAAFDRALSLGAHPVAPTPIPFAGAEMPAYLIPAEGRETEVRPLLILTNGYDATVVDMYFASAVAASRRGWHVLVFDGPGQGGTLYEQGVPMRADWETVVAAVVDFALTQPIVDPDRIALSGWSLGGHLSLRAATGEPRLAAVVADPGLWSIEAPMRGMAAHLGLPEAAVTAILAGDETTATLFGKTLAGFSPRMRWSLEKRAFWVHGVSDFPACFKAMAAFTLEGRADRIRCPTLICAAESDPLSATAQATFDALSCPKTLMRFGAAEGAGDHCEMGARSVLDWRTLDWLDATLA